jgi:ATP-dependent RNA helicase DHX37/DHR1
LTTFWQIAKRIDEFELKDGDDKQKLKFAYLTPDMEEPVYLHESSVLLHERPEFVAYQEIFETSKLYMRGVTTVDANWFATFCPSQCNFSPPLPDPEPRYDSERVRFAKKNML